MRARRLQHRAQTGGGGDHWRASCVDGVDDFGVVDSLEVDRGDPEVRRAQLPLGDDEWDTLVGHLDRVGVPELMRREPTSDPGRRGGAPELSATGCRFPAASGGRAVDHAEERANRVARSFVSVIDLAVTFTLLGAKVKACRESPLRTRSRFPLT